MKPVKELIAVPEEKKHLCVGCCFNNKENLMGAKRLNIYLTAALKIIAFTKSCRLTG